MLSLAVALVIASGTMLPSKAHANAGVITAVVAVGLFGILFLAVDTIEAAATDNDHELSIDEIRKELEEAKARLEELENPSQ